MLSYISRSAQLAPALKSTAQAVANGSKNIVPGVCEGVAAELVQPSPLALTTTAMAKRCATGPVRARAGVAGTWGCARLLVTSSWSNLVKNETSLEPRKFGLRSADP